MGLKSFLILGLLPQLPSAHFLSVRQSVTCEFTVAASSGDTCTTFAAEWGLTEASFQALNPGVACPTMLVAGQSYCVLGTVSSATSTSTASTATYTTNISTKPMITSTFYSTTKTTASSPHEPTQSGLVSNCNSFYLVSSGDTCAAIESKFGISAQEFDTWNPSINSGCTNLFLGYYVCVGIPGAVTRTTSSTATFTAPSPEMPSTVRNCKKFYLVKSGDTCITIESASGITAAQFFSWNPAVDSACDNLWLGYYVCVGV